MGRGQNSVLYGDRQAVPGRQRGPGIWNGVPKQTASPFCTAVEAAIERVGMAPRNPPREAQVGFQRLLPVAAANGHWQALKEAFAAGEAVEHDENSQLEWLARELVIERPVEDDDWRFWREEWVQAGEESGLPLPERLDLDARREFIRQLLSLPRYSMRKVDSLAAAFKVQAGQ